MSANGMSRRTMLKMLEQATELSKEVLDGIAYDLLSTYFECVSQHSEILILPQAEPVHVATNVPLDAVRKFFRRSDRIDTHKTLPDESLEAIVLIVKRPKNAEPLVVEKLKKTSGKMKPFLPKPKQR